MTQPDSNFSQGSIGGGTSKELVYLQHILTTLDRSQASFDDGNIERFNLYVQYLSNAVLDSEKRKEIKDMMIAELPDLKKQYKDDDKTINFMLGFIVIREVMMYLNDICEFEHEDVMGLVGLPEEITPEEDMVDAYNLYEEEEMKQDEDYSQYPDYPEEANGDA